MRYLSRIYTCTLVLALSVPKISTLSSGAPKDVCDVLTPLHRDTRKADSYPPYEIRPLVDERQIRITLGSTQGLPFRGFIVHAKDVQTSQIIGKFQNLPADVQIIQCNLNNDTVTHSNSKDKHNLELEWTPPEDYEGTIIFNSTFVQDYGTYWVGVESPEITISTSTINVMAIVPPSTTQRTTTVPSYSRNTDNLKQSNRRHPIYDGCGVTKNCFGNSDQCTDSGECRAAVGIEVKGEKYIFELFSTSGSYVAVGLSNDKQMGDDSVVECTKDDDKIGVHMSWNRGKRNMRISTPDGAVSLINSSLENSSIYCKFIRNRLTTVQGQEYDLLNRDYYLLLASGTNLKETGGVSYHDINFAASGGAKKLSDIGQITVSSNILIVIHGALMIASWIGTASIGMLIARYYKRTWTNSQLCGNDQWFAWHRIFMILTWSMTTISCIIIFIHTGGWSSETIHSTIGLVTTLLTFIQPFLALVRPHPNTPRRPIFNWVHWFIGVAAQMTAVIALFFSVRLSKAKIPLWVDYIIASFVAFHILVHLTLMSVGFYTDKKEVNTVNAFPMKSLHHRVPVIHIDVKQDAPFTAFRRIMFGIYFTVTVLFSLTFIIIVVMAPIEESWNIFTTTILSINKT